MKKIKLFVVTALVVSLLGATSFAAITTTPKGVQKLDSADIVDALNNNADVLDNHIDKIAGKDVLGHVKIANDLETSDSETALSAAMGANLNKSLSDINYELITGENYVVKKYNNGLMEIDGSLSLGQISIDNVWGSLYISHEYSGLTFPVAFTSIISCEQNFNSSNDSEAAFIMNSSQASITNSPKFHIMSGVAKTISDGSTLQYRAVGMWK